jgi:TonB family protein
MTPLRHWLFALPFALLPLTAVAASPLEDPAECGQAREADLDGKALEAVALQEQCVAKTPMKGLFLSNEYRSLAYYHRAAGQHEQAIAAFTRAIETMNMPNALLLQQRGKSHLELGHLDEAKADFDAALVDDPRDAGATFGKAQVLQRQGKPDEARPLLLQAFQFGERSREFLQSLGASGLTPDDLPEIVFPPRMPVAAIRTCAFGAVKVRVTVDTWGFPANIVIEQSSGNRDLDRATMDAARKWHFKPGHQDGKRVGGDVVVPVNFSNPCA